MSFAAYLFSSTTVERISHQPGLDEFRERVDRGQSSLSDQAGDQHAIGHGVRAISDHEGIGAGIPRLCDRVAIGARPGGRIDRQIHDLGIELLRGRAYRSCLPLPLKSQGEKTQPPQPREHLVQQRDPLAVDGRPCIDADTGDIAARMRQCLDQALLDRIRSAPRSESWRCAP